MFGDGEDFGGEDGNLHFRRSGITFFGGKFADDGLFLFLADRHVSFSWAGTSGTRPQMMQAMPLSDERGVVKDVGRETKRNERP
jgi:hypothetical protein